MHHEFAATGAAVVVSEDGGTAEDARSVIGVGDSSPLDRPDNASAAPPTPSTTTVATAPPTATALR